MKGAKSRAFPDPFVAIATMLQNVKTEGRQTKLLAAIAVFAMVVCALAIVLPSGGVFAADGDVQESTDVTADTGSAELDPEVHSASLTIDGTTTYYETLVAAWDVAVNQTEPATIVLLKDETGGGLQSISNAGANVTLDLNGHTYIATSDPAGSTGTKNQGMQLLRGNTFLIMNGTFKTVTGEDGAVKNGINVYCDTELRDVTLDFSQSNGDGEGFNGLQLANGVVKITGSTSIIDRPEDYTIAFFANWNSYTDGSQVTIDTTGTIDGVIAIADYYANENCGNSSLNIVNMGVTENTVIKYELSDGYGFDLDVSDNVSVDVVADKGYQIAGTVTFGTSTITLSSAITAGENGIQLSKGSIIIDGTIDATQSVTINASGQVEINGTVVGTGSTGGLTITDDGEEGTQVTIGDLTIDNGGSLTIPNGVTVNLIGTIKVEEESSTGSGDAGSLYIAGQVIGQENAAIVGAYETAADAVIDDADTTGADETVDASSYDALQKGTITSGKGSTGEWTFVSGKLTLNNYTGSMYFYNQATITEVELIGENVISIPADAVSYYFSVDTTAGVFAAIKNNTGDMKVTGDGTLEITVKTPADLTGKTIVGIYAGGALTVDTDGLNADFSGVDTVIDGNVQFESLDVPELTISEGATLVVGDLTVDSIVNKGGIIIVQGSLDYAGSEMPIVQVGMPSTVSSGSIYFLGALNDISGRVSVVNVQNPMEIPEGAYITSVIPSAKDIVGYDSVIIVSVDTVTFSGEELTVDYIVIGNATGEVILGDNTITATAAENLEVSGVQISFGSTVTVSAETDLVTVTGDVTGLVLGEIPVTVIGSMESGTITGGTGESETELNFTNVDLTGLVMTAGSVQISGSFEFNGQQGTSGTISGDGTLIILDDTEITGNGTISVEHLIVNEGVTLTIGEDVTIVVSTGKTLTVEEDAVITGQGIIELTGNGITNNGTIEVEIDSGEGYGLVADENGQITATEFLNAITYYDTVYITGAVGGDITIVNDNTTDGYSEISVENVLIYVEGRLVIGADVYVDFDRVTFYGADISEETDSEGNTTYTPDTSANSGAIYVRGELYISNSDVYANVQAHDAADDDEDGIVSVTGPKTMEVSIQTVGNLGDVGYGNIMSIVGDFTIEDRTNLNVFGTLNVTGNLTIASSATITVYGAGDLNVTGTLTLNGNITVNGTGDVSGTMTVGTDGELNANGEFDVTGTLTITGTLSGTVTNHGTVAFDGTSSEATIYVMDGSSTTVESVDGTLTISDDGAAADVGGEETDRYQYETKDGNEIVITDMEDTDGTNLIIGVTVTSYTENDVLYFESAMDVSGEIVADDVDMSADAGIVISQTLDIEITGTDEALDFDGILDVTGTMNVDGAFNATGGEITVTGEVTVIADRAADAEIDADTGVIINATYYTISTAASGNVAAYATGYYTSFDAALGQIANADDDTITVMGEQEATVEATIASGQTVVVSSGSKLTVGSGITLTVASGGVVDDNAYNGTATEDPTCGIFVDGILTFENYSTGYDAPGSYAIVADVVVVNEPARTFMSLAGAIGSGMEDIVLNQDVIISEDLLIPAGTTVSSDEYGITVGVNNTDAGEYESDVTLTVEGAVELTGTSPGMKFVTGFDSRNNETESTLVVGGEDGYVMVPQNSTDLDSFAGAHYTKDIGERGTELVDIVSTLMHAADDSANVYVDSTTDNAIITVRGQITVDSLEFIAPEEATLVVEVDSLVDSDVDSSLRFNQIILGMNVVLSSEAYELTGAVVMQDADGNVVSEVDLSRAVGIIVYAHVEPEIEDEPERDCMEIMGMVVKGTVTVSAGTVYTEGLYVLNGEITDSDDDPSTSDVTLEGSGSLVISSGATLVVTGGTDEYSALGITGVGSNIAMTVDGTLLIEGTADVHGAVINGTVIVQNNGTFDVDGNVVLNGTIDIITTDDYKDSKLVISGDLTVGSKPTEIGASAEVGTINGTVEIGADGMLKVYPGADIANAEIWSGAASAEVSAESMQFVISGETYMIVYFDENNDTAVWVVLAGEDFELVGVNNGYNYSDLTADAPDYNESNSGLYRITAWYSDASMPDNRRLSEDTLVTDYDAVYITAQPANVVGTVSVGVGIQLYIDDVPRDSSATFQLGVGEHTVRFEVETGYNGDNVVISFNGQTVQNNGTITIEAGATSFNLTASGAVPSSGDQNIDITVPGSEDDGMSLTDILLIVLVILILVMAVIVALRLMRS